VMDAVEAAKEKGMTIHTVGVGDPDGALIPIAGQNGGEDFVLDESGQPVKTALDEVTLKKVAEVTGGIYAPLGRGGEGLATIYQETAGFYEGRAFSGRLSPPPGAVILVFDPAGNAVTTNAGLSMTMQSGATKRQSLLTFDAVATGDYTVVDEIAATVWGWPYDPQGETWQVVTMDDRPAAGILAESSLFMRYESAGANYNRGRANAITTALLCHDFQSLDIEVDGVDLSDPDAVNEAVTELPECSGCHHTLDPIASNLFGHFPKFNNMQFDQFPLPSGYFPAT